jgi:hypothetical protein
VQHSKEKGGVQADVVVGCWLLVGGYWFVSW